MVRLRRKWGVVRRHLIWHLLFKGSTVLDWFLIFEDMNLNLKSAPRLVTICQCGVLIEASKTRKRLDSFNSRTRPLFKKLKAQRLERSSASKSETKSLLDVVVQNLVVPNKGLPTSELYSKSEVKFRYPPVPEKPYIGVGYKDKGSLGNSVVMDAIVSEILEPDFGSDFFHFLKLWEDFLGHFTQDLVKNPSPATLDRPNSKFSN
jgi:hypothetical protein